MGNVERYQQIVQALLEEYSTSKPSHGDIEVEVSFDVVRHHYQIWHLGWMGKRRVHHSPVHCAIRNGKVWLLANSTERDVAADFVERGIPKEDIVLGFHPRYMREYSDYAVG
ncbi:MAG: XisI protein [Cyanobacteria bacterium J06649_4]